MLWRVQGRQLEALQPAAAAARDEFYRQQLRSLARLDLADDSATQRLLQTVAQGPPVAAPSIRLDDHHDQ